MAWLPFYAMARVFDEPLHKVFYCASHHKNINQIPYGVHTGLEIILGTTVTSLMLLSFFPSNQHRQRTAQLYAITMPCVWITKALLKLIPMNASLRPRNQCFNRCANYYGGFPSGHVMETVYTATLFGIQMGLWYGIPLGVLAGAIAVNSITFNRHFLSQMVAGAGLGMMFAAAANRALLWKSDLQISVVCDEGYAVRVQGLF